MKKVVLCIKLVVLCAVLNGFVKFAFSTSILPFGLPFHLNMEKNVTTGYTVVDGTAEVSVEGIEEIELSFVAGNIGVVPYEGDVFRIDYAGGSVDCLYQVSGNKLEISPDFGWFNFGGSEHSDGDMTLYVPLTLTNLDVQATVVNGTIEIGIAGDELSMESVNGTLRAFALFDSIEIETVSSDEMVIATDETTTREIKCDSISGTLTLEGGFNYEVELDSVSGDILGDGPDEDISHKIAIELDSISGDFIHIA